ncbi:MAG: response regulator [Chloroflexi bacterium]|nr:response regulator [Chloroflexota bacterium]
MADVALIVDDEKIIRDLLEAFLETEGYETYTASSGIEGLRQVYDKRPDVVISDVVMSGMDGYEFCYLAHEMCGVPVMMVTGVKAESNILRFKPDVDDYMLKPFDMDEFLRRVARLISRSRQRSMAGVS